MKEHRLVGMKCASCVRSIQAALEEAGIAGAEVTLTPPVLRLPDTFSDLSAVDAALKRAGPYALQSDSPVAAESAAPRSASESLMPLFIILGYIVGSVVLNAFLRNDFSPASLMSVFMGIFFLVFSGFKMINLSGFADAYATYDVIAQQSRPYAFAYPFVELALGVMYLSGLAPLATNLLTTILMSISAVGVYRALSNDRRIQCACLGTALNLPMTKITLVENLGMGIMALTMLMHIWGAK